MSWQQSPTYDDGRYAAPRSPLLRSRRSCRCCSRRPSRCRTHAAAAAVATVGEIVSIESDGVGVSIRKPATCFIGLVRVEKSKRNLASKKKADGYFPDDERYRRTTDRGGRLAIEREQCATRRAMNGIDEASMLSLRNLVSSSNVAGTISNRAPRTVWQDFVFVSATPSPSILAK